MDDVMDAAAALPGLPDASRPPRGALPGLRLAAPRSSIASAICCPSPISTATPSTRRSRSATIRSAARQAADHRRRQARRCLDLLLHRPHLRRALGHAHVQGARAVPGRGDPEARHGEICRGRARSAPAYAHPDAAGRAAVDRRGLSRSVRHGAAASRFARCHACPIRPRHRDGDRHLRLGGAELLQVSGEARLRHGQAARLRHHRPRRGEGACSAPCPSRASGASARSPPSVWPATGWRRSPTSRRATKPT